MLPPPPTLYPEFPDIMGSESTNYLVLGTWTPMHMNDTVCTDSLALLDTSSTLKQDVMLFQENYNTKLRNGEIDLRKGTIAAVRKNKDQKWYHYSNMTTDEMIIFHHFDSNEFRQNAHVSFTPNYCNKNHEKRKSIDSRIFVQF
eukprot:428812_1